MFKANMRGLRSTEASTMPSRAPRQDHGGVTSRSGIVGAVARFWQRTYAPDYVGFAMLLTAYLLVSFTYELSSWKLNRWF